MLYHLLYPMGSNLILFNVFKYISFRASYGHADGPHDQFPCWDARLWTT